MFATIGSWTCFIETSYSLASDAVTFNISLSNKIKGSVNNCSLVLEAIDLTLNKLNTALAALVNVTVIVAALAASFDTNKDFTIALELLGAVYKTVSDVVVWAWQCCWLRSPDCTIWAVTSMIPRGAA